MSGVVINVQDNGLGAASPGAGNTIVVAGVSSAGTANQPVFSTNPKTFTTTFGYGPGPQLAAAIAEETGNPVGFVKVATGGAYPNGANTAVTYTAAGTPYGGAMTLTGNPVDTFYGKVTCTSGGNTIAAGGNVLAISLDAGRTTLVTIQLQAGQSTYLIPNTGITLNFSAGTIQTGDVFQWISTEPTWSDATVSSALSSLVTTAIAWKDVYIPGGASALGGVATTVGAGTVGAANGDVQAVDGYMTSLFNSRRYGRAYMQARDVAWGGSSSETELQWIASIQAAHINDSSLRVGVTAGHYNVISAIDQSQYRRPALFLAALRDSAVAIQVDLGRVSDGALVGLTLPTAPDGFVYHDESVNPGLDAARFLSLWSIITLPGLYILNPNLMAPPGSDFTLLQHGAVIDAASLIAYQFFVKRLSSSVRVNPTTGFILQQDANTLQQQANAALANGLGNAVSSATCTVGTTDNILATNTITVTVAIVPLGYLKTINITITFTNPALAPVQTPGVT
jgi:uncharacterized protein DUF2586